MEEYRYDVTDFTKKKKNFSCMEHYRYDGIDFIKK